MVEEKQTVRVRITAVRRVHYVQVVDMPAEEWADLRDTESDAASGIIEDWLDPADVHYANPLEAGDFEAERVGDDGEPVDPGDRQSW